jgi:hypothetical protein
MSGVDGVSDRDSGETWHLRQLWQFAKNRGYSVELEDDRIWVTPSDHGSAAPGRSFPATRAGMQAALVGCVPSEIERWISDHARAHGLELAYTHEGNPKWWISVWSCACSGQGTSC